jgi:hypothetical protein
MGADSASARSSERDGREHGSRRITLTFVALIAALLVLAVVPLGVSITANDRQSFRYDTVSAAHQVSSAAEEFLADHHPATAMDAAARRPDRRDVDLAGAPHPRPVSTRRRS